ncbi:MAG: hypothetical protein PHV42_03155 [Candidatus Pacebacteria bacterium]|nr:hypothetical protein [Candidatus Paceibacterota bacterium]
MWYESLESWWGGWVPKTGDMVQSNLPNGELHAKPVGQAVNNRTDLPPLPPGQYYGPSTGTTGDCDDCNKKSHQQVSTKVVEKTTIVNIYNDPSHCPFKGAMWYKERRCWDRPPMPHPGYYWHVDYGQWVRPPRPGPNYGWNNRGWWETFDTSGEPLQWDLGFVGGVRSGHR